MWWWLTFCSATVMVKGSNPTSFTKESECSQGSLCYAVHKVQREYVKKYPSSSTFKLNICCFELIKYTAITS